MATTNTFAPVADSLGKGKWVDSLPARATIAVVGAGAFGGWSALHLLRAGFNVTLIDAWGPGHSRSSSGDETRVSRSTYGANELYFDLNVRALELWKENELRWRRQFFFNTGAVWLCHDEKTPQVDDSIPYAKKHGMEYEYLSVSDLNKRYPAIRSDDLHHAYFDAHAGYLKARDGCQAVKAAFCDEGGTFKLASVKPGAIQSSSLTGLNLSDGTSVVADVYLFACGAWLGQLFPEVLGKVITCTKQEVYYFGTPEDRSAEFESLPVWIDADGKDYYYGIPGNAHRGFKLGVDKRGDPFDPTNGEHLPSPGVLTDARKFIANRFPSLGTAPLIESRVCPYENSPDGNFIFDVHPEASNLFFLGGGSGHGYKHGPALGEWVAKVFEGKREIPACWLT